MSAMNNSSQPDEGAKFRFASVLAQIEISSCFRNDVEPLFRLLGPKIPVRLNP
jgi:hypothetical protein